MVVTRRKMKLEKKIRSKLCPSQKKLWKMIMTKTGWLEEKDKKGNKVVTTNRLNLEEDTKEDENPNK